MRAPRTATSSNSANCSPQSPDTRPRNRTAGAAPWSASIQVGAGSRSTRHICRLLSFWTRKDAAHRVAEGSLRSLIGELRAFRDLSNRAADRDGSNPRRETRMLTIGHSFGGLIVYSALAQYWTDRAAASLIQSRYFANKTTGQASGTDDLREIPSYGDLVVVVNPAYEAMRYEPVRQLLDHQQTGKLPARFAPRQGPVLVQITSVGDTAFQGDWATGVAFPIGRALNTFTQPTRADPVTGDDERQQIERAVGHYQPYWTHDLDRPQGPELANAATLYDPNAACRSFREFDRTARGRRRPAEAGLDAHLSQRRRPHRDRTRPLRPGQSVLDRPRTSKHHPRPQRHHRPGLRRFRRSALWRHRPPPASIALRHVTIGAHLMAFLEAFDALPTDDPARTGLFYQWLRRDWRALFAELRMDRPILPLPAFTVLTRWADVVDALSRNETFRVPYGPHMDPSVGTFMLGHDGVEQNWRDKSVMRALMRWDDVPQIRALAAMTAQTALAAAGPDTVDIVQTVSRLVPLRIVQQSFGFPGPDDASMLRWSWATQADMFHNLSNDPKLLANCIQAGTEMRAWVRAFLSDREPWLRVEGDATVARLLRATGAGLSGLETEGVVSNICGLLVGSIETTSQAIVNATEQILLRQDVTARAIDAAKAADIEALDAIVWEALRFNPMTTFVARVVAESALLAPGSPHQAAVKPGTVIAVGIGSAMFDPSVFPDPDGFHVRRRSAYLHTGFGPHECLGKFVAYAIIPETIRQILLLPGIRLLDGGGSRIDDAGGPFAEHFVLAHG